nr:T9SS type A sorting domain-containing protein [Ignavibacteriaceae bacterium]
GFVTLKVYNVSGVEVATLVGRQMETGRHDVSFDATQLSSGVYFYRLQFGTQIITRKMVVMK